MRYAPNTIINKTRSDVKVTVAREKYVRLHHPKMHIHIKFGVPTSKNMRYAPNTKILKTRSEVKVTVTRNGMCDTPSSQDAFKHQIWNSYLKEYRRI